MYPDTYTGPPCHHPRAGRPQHRGNGHSADQTPDYGPEPDTGRGAPRTPPANRARCTGARPRRNASTAAGCHGRSAARRTTPDSPGSRAGHTCYR